MLARDASFVVVDVETTGSRAASDRLIEIGAVRVRSGRITDRYQQLINPGCSIPRRITWLTGITTAMIFDEPAIESVMPRFSDFLSDGIFVAHNLSFDWRLINEERARLFIRPLTNQTLCTLRLARRLLPGLRSKGLSSLAGFFGIKMKRHHRALDDAEATAEILLRFLDRLQLEFGIESLEEILAFQNRRYGGLKQESAQIDRIRREVLPTIPEKPGVYFMKDRRDQTIYIGKARSLRSRVRSYFSAIEGHPPRIRKMIRRVRGIEWQVTDSELDALLLESRLIKRQQPEYNRASLAYVNRPFLRINTAHDFPDVSWTAFLLNDGAEYYGPLASRAEANFIADVIGRFFTLRECDDSIIRSGKRCVYASIGRCSAPCDGSISSAGYAAELDRLRAFLNGEDRSVLERIADAMKASAAEMDYEQAGIYRDWIRRLERTLDLRRAVAARVLEHNGVLIHQNGPRGIELLVIRYGRHVGTIHTPAYSDDENLWTSLGSYFSADDEPERYREQEIDEIYLLTHWMYLHRDRVRHVPWSRRTPPERFFGEVQRRIAEFASA